MSSTATNISPAKEIDHLVRKFADWRGDMLSQIRNLIRQADPDIIEAVKWKTPSNPDGVPLWSHDGMICTGEVYKKHLRITFSKGPNLNDPTGLINSYRAIIIHEEDKIDSEAFKSLIRSAVEINRQSKLTKR